MKGVKGERYKYWSLLSMFITGWSIEFKYLHKRLALEASELCPKLKCLNLEAMWLPSHGSNEEGSTTKWVSSWLPIFLWLCPCVSHKSIPEIHVSSRTSNLRWPPPIEWPPSQGNLLDGGDRNWRWILSSLGKYPEMSRIAPNFVWTFGVYAASLMSCTGKVKVKGRLIFLVRADGLILGVTFLYCCYSLVYCVGTIVARMRVHHTTEDCSHMTWQLNTTCKWWQAA